MHRNRSSDCEISLRFSHSCVDFRAWHKLVKQHIYNVMYTNNDLVCCAGTQGYTRGY